MPGGERPYCTSDLSRILDLPARRLRAWARAGLLRPTRGTRGELRFGFRELVAARTIAKLLREGADLRQIQAAVEAARNAEPSLEVPLAEVRFRFEGGRVLFQHGSALAADTGELCFDFDPPSAAGGSSRARAEEEFARGCEAAWEREDLGAAERHFREALAIDPSFADAWCDLGTVVCRLGDPREARRMYLRALELEMDHPEALCNLGRLLLQEGLADVAADYLRRAIAVAPSFALAHLHMGVALELTGDPTGAAQHIARAIELDPDAEWAQEARTALRRLQELLPAD